MKELELSKEEYQRIFQGAHSNFVNKASTGQTFLCECIVDSFLSLTSSSKYIVKNGKIYHSESNKTKGEKAQKTKKNKKAKYNVS